ncbi:hypothetical protein GCM10022415_33570 [Knoellia locipacati]|uniref:AbiTii domain-containing protein n=1 Tax=Knoellia locipacati TaxID=882824 RepID=A0A512T4V0_9MICO|nr:hypothetical protein [Knoellia locipacati]GEQ15229.1 hypothetical protein KLO01_32760 [Knoellia locipacati]
MTDRRAAALELAEDLLADFELSRLAPTALVRKSSRLARLLDDRDVLEWLTLELNGYRDVVTGKMLSGTANFALRTGRGHYDQEEKTTKYWTDGLGAIEAHASAATAHMKAAADAPVSVSSANPHQIVSAPTGNARERTALLTMISRNQGLVEGILAAVHSYVSEKEVELRFGAAVESAFGQVRNTVDANIAELVPDAAVKLAAAFENAGSDNAEDWASSAATCRRLLKAVADALRPAGPKVDGRAMGEDQYINRLVDWIVNSSAAGETSREVVKRDLEYLGNRLDALAGAGHKGAHSEVTRYEASRFITGTYLLIGDILQLRPDGIKETADEVVEVDGADWPPQDRQPDVLT